MIIHLLLLLLLTTTTTTNTGTTTTATIITTLTSNQVVFNLYCIKCYRQSRAFIALFVVRLVQYSTVFPCKFEQPLRNNYAFVSTQLHNWLNSAIDISILWVTFLRYRAPYAKSIKYIIDIRYMLGVRTIESRDVIRYVHKVC